CYGDRNDEVLDETSTPGTGFLAEVVRDWEEQVRPLREESTGTRVAIVRTGLVLSRRGGALKKMLPLFSKGVGGKLGSGHQWMSWVHIADIARLFAFCIDDEGTSGVVNGSAPEPVKNDRFTIELARSLAKPVFLPVPEVALKVVLGELAENVLGGQRVLPKRTQEMGFRFEYPDFVKAIRELCEPLQNGQREFVSEQWVPKKPSEIHLERIAPPFLLRGPYRKWHHTHDFIPSAGGTLIRDRVVYKLPLGLFGNVTAGWKVAGDVAQIFGFRRRIIQDLFGTSA
ncbi:MAG: TIGR01777 family oxidoreductase, partial [Bdellovibrionota bacterium]